MCCRKGSGFAVQTPDGKEFKFDTIEDVNNIGKILDNARNKEANSFFEESQRTLNIMKQNGWTPKK